MFLNGDDSLTCNFYFKKNADCRVEAVHELYSVSFEFPPHMFHRVVPLLPRSEIPVRGEEIASLLTITKTTPARSVGGSNQSFFLCTVEF